MARCSTVLLFVLFLFSVDSLAATDSHWVLGSYVHEKNALAEKVRLTELLGAQVIIQLDEDKQLYRVLIPESQIEKSQLQSFKVDAWRLREPVTQSSRYPTEEGSAEEEPAEEGPGKEEPAEASLVEAVEPIVKAPGSISVIESSTDNTSKELIPAEPLFPEFEATESYEQYCVRLPDSSLCTHPGMVRMLEKARRANAQAEKIKSACRTDPAARSKEICQQWLAD